MAAVTVRELLTRLGVEADTDAVKEYDRALGDAKTVMVAAAAAAAGLAAALVGVSVATARQGDEAAKAGARVGVSAAEMQELGFAAEQSGAALVDVETAFRRQARAAWDASQGTGRAAETYKRLGISVKDSAGNMKEPLPLFLETAEAMKGLATETEKSAVANDLFGRGGAKILPLINAGAEGINNLRQQAQDLGFVLDAKAAKASEDFNDRMNEVRLVLVGVRNEVGKRLIPIFTDLLAGFRDFVVANRAVIRQAIDRNMARISKAIDLVRRAVRRADTVVRKRLGGWANLIKQIEKVAGFSALLTGIVAVIKLTKAARIAFAGMALAGGPLTVALAAATVAIVGAALALEDLIVFAQGGESAIGRFLDRFDPALAEEFRATLNGLGAEFSNLGAAIADALGPLAGVFDGFGELAEAASVSLLLGFFERMNEDLRIAVGYLQLVTELIKSISGEGDVFGTMSRLRGEFVERSRARGREAFAAQVAGLGQVGAGVATVTAPSAATGAASTTVNQGGDQITMNITGPSVEEMVQVSERLRTDRNRRALAAVAGGER